MPNYSPQTPIDPQVEMFQRGKPMDAFFNMKSLRPISTATDFDTDFEDSDLEDNNSPRLSVNSKESERTLSSFEEIHTPGPQNEFRGFDFDVSTKRQMEGPRLPHLFRSSINSQTDLEDDEYEEALAMSPLTPRPSSNQRAAMTMDSNVIPVVHERQRHPNPMTDTVEHLDSKDLALWTPRQVANWMQLSGFEPSIVEKFEENDISGAILVTLKFEDLKELDIPSFGQRTRLWNELITLRDSKPSTPSPPTPIEEVASPCVERLPRHTSRRRNGSRVRNGSRMRDESADCGSEEQPRRHKSRKHRKHILDDVITPLESVSIVGIEQLMPKPHKCAKGENCSKWRKQQRLINNFKKDHPVSPEGGSIWIAGNPGNPKTAEAIDLNQVRPISDAVPSEVASSGVFGPEEPVPTFHLEEASLRNLQSRDPQDAVKKFLQFQHMDPQQAMYTTSEEPPTPPYEMFPNLDAPRLAHAAKPVAGLRGLPRLAIPGNHPVPPPRSASAQPFSPYRMERVSPLNPDLRSATKSPSTAIYRFGTPFSEMDIPVTAVPLGPVSRDASQSVPPNMNYHDVPKRTQSRTSARHPSFAMPRVDEIANISTAPPTQIRFRQDQIQQPSSSAAYPLHTPAQRTADDISISHSGFVKKRKTRFLRHEWTDHYASLKGTRLALHDDARAMEALEYIDVDDYAIACSSNVASSKLNAAFKAMNISRGEKSKKDEAAFAFQLIPSGMDKGKLKKREAGADDKDRGKTHYFAVKSRDERIDWMRELMLAKALKQKSEGYTVNMNGNVL